MSNGPEGIGRIFRFSDPRQARIHGRLVLVGPGPAAFYRDVCGLMATAPFLEATTHVVAHLLREIESAIRDILLPHTYVAPKKGTGRHLAEIEAILQAYSVDTADPAGIAWRRLADDAHEERLAPFAHRESLGAPRKLDEKFRRFVAEVEMIFGLVLERFESRFLGALPVIDELLKKTSPTQADVKTLQGKVPHNFVTHEYFFSRVEAPEWLALLATGGFFNHPPDPVRDDEKGMVRFSPWPESRYLVRMAGRHELQGRVVEIALAIPDTININVHEDLMAIALAVPAALSAMLVPRLKAAMQLPYQLRLMYQAGNLVSHLARGGQGTAALEVTEAFLRVLPDPEVKGIPDDKKQWRLSPQPRSPFDEWVLGEFLKNNLDDVVDAGGLDALRVVCQALDDAVRLSRSPGDESPDDYSTIWRPAIDGDEDRGHELKSMLVGAVRDAAERLIERHPDLVAEVVDRLEARPWAVFRRIALHALNRTPDAELPAIEMCLADRETFQDRKLKREYVLLAERVFPKISQETKQTILGWIDEGPEVGPYRRVCEKMEGRTPTDEELVEYTDRWRLEYLRALRDVLPEAARKRYEELVAKYGEPEKPDFLGYRSSGFTRGFQSPSPIGGAELRQLPVADIVSRLAVWEPSGECLGPSPEGLGRELAGVVAEDPVRFAEDAERFTVVDPTYVRGVLSGLRDATRHERPFSWAPVLRLCLWVGEQPVEPGEQGQIGERDRGWGWSRAAVADLLEEGFKLGPAAIPFEFRREGWDALLPLTDDPDPAEADDAGDVNREPEVDSLNTTRGKAMHALVRYALWVREHLDKAAESTEAKGAGLVPMPEVREVLEAHLDPARDPSPAIRSVYGRWLPWLVLLDPEWVKANLAGIFPADEMLARLRDAAWDTYIVSSRVYNGVPEILEEEYERAAERIGQVSHTTRRPADPADHLAEHLMVLYWQGRIRSDSPALIQFYANAPDGVCGHAMWFVGRVFSEDAEDPPAEIVDRMKELLEWRMSSALRVDPQRHRGELEQFGSWFSSGRFGEEWSLTKLQETLGLVGAAAPDNLVMDQLVKWVPARPIEVLACTRLMIEGADEPWKIEAWQSEIRQIGRSALKGDERAREAATALVNILAARGYLQSQDLLDGK